MKFSSPDDIFQIRVNLIDIEPAVWRRLLVPQDLSLPRLHTALQLAMGWTDSHLHQFKVHDLRFAEPDEEEFEPGPIDYRQISLNQIAPRQGATCIYEYDFGDSWDHLILVEDELPVESVEGPLPRCVDGERACPPEDCGGPRGYADLLEALRDPNHPGHHDLRRWAGTRFDPEAFDLNRVNGALARSFSSKRPRAGGGSPPGRPRIDR